MSSHVVIAAALHESLDGTAHDSDFNGGLAVVRWKGAYGYVL